MEDNENNLRKLVLSLSEAVEEKHNLSTMDYIEKRAFYYNAYLLAITITQEAVKGMDTVSRQSEVAIAKALVNLSTQQSTPIDVPAKQQVFTSSEVMRIANIKGKNTINKYFHDGTIKASQNKNTGRWSVTRENLAAYLGTDNF